MFFNKKLFGMVLKLGIHIVKKERTSVKNYNNFIIGQKRNRLIVNLDYTFLTAYQVFLFMYRLSINNGSLLFIERLEKFEALLDSISESTSQKFISEEFWIEGTLTNFTRLKWEHLLKGKNLGNRLPDTVVIFDNSWFDNLLTEVSKEMLPILGTLKFSDQDKFLSYFILGGFKDFDSVFFFCKVLSLAIIGSKSLKLKYLNSRERVRKLRRKPKKRRKLLKKMKWARLFRKNVSNMRLFKAPLKHSLRRYQLIRNVFQRYYDSKKIIYAGGLIYKEKRKVSKKLDLPSKRVSNRTQSFVARYETRLSSVLYRFGVCKNVNVAKRLIFAKNVYVNNKPISNKNYFIKPGDVVQLNFRKCKSFQLVSFIKKAKRTRRRLAPRRTRRRRKSRVLSMAKTYLKFRNLVEAALPNQNNLLSHRLKLVNKFSYPSPLGFYGDRLSNNLLSFYKKEQVSRIKLWKPTSKRTLSVRSDLKQMPSIYQKVFGASLQKNKFKVSQQFAKKLMGVTKVRHSNFAKSTYRNVLYKLSASKKKTWHFFGKNNKVKGLSNKFFRKTLLRSPLKRSRYVLAAKKFSKFNRKFYRKNFPNRLGYLVCESEKGVTLEDSEVSTYLGKWVNYYENVHGFTLLNARRTLSSRKSKLKFKKVVKVKGKPWWFNRERKLHLKFFSWKKGLVGKKIKESSFLFPENKTSMLFFFNWILKKKQKERHFSKVLFFKRLVFAYRLFLSNACLEGISDNVGKKQEKKSRSLRNRFWWPFYGRKKGFWGINKRYPKKKTLRRDLILWGFNLLKGRKRKFMSKLNKVSSRIAIPVVNKDKPFWASNRILECLQKVKRYRKLKRVKFFVYKKAYLDRRAKFKRRRLLERRKKRKRRRFSWRSRNLWFKKKRKKKKSKHFKKMKVLVKRARWRLRKKKRSLLWKKGSPYKGPVLKSRRSYPKNFFFNKKYCVGLYLYTPNTKKIPIYSQMLTLKRLKTLANS